MPDSNRILIVDDDQDITNGTVLRLRAAGYETMVASNGEEGVASANKHRPDAIVMDVRMPRMDGLAALSRLKHGPHTRPIPVVMLSASLRDEQAAMAAGARYFLKKPYRSDELLLAVKSALSDTPVTCEE